MFVYVISEPGATLVKIGRSVSPAVRLRGLQTMSPVQLELRAVWETSDDAEGLLHQEFARRRRHGEWFDFTDVDPVQAISEFLGSTPAPLGPPPAEDVVEEDEDDRAVEEQAEAERARWRQGYEAQRRRTEEPAREPAATTGTVRVCADCKPEDHAGMDFEQMGRHWADQAPPMGDELRLRLKALLRRKPTTRERADRLAEGTARA